MGTVATLVALEWPSSAGSVDRKAASDFAFQLAKHVAGTYSNIPLFLSLLFSLRLNEL